VAFSDRGASPRRTPLDARSRGPRRPAPLAVAFYISGHGFGHASRQIEVINAFARRRPDIGIFLRTTVTRWLLDRTIVPPFELDDRPCDTGVVQIDSLRLDAEASIAQADAFYRTLDARVEAEAAVLKAQGVVLAIADAPPLGCAAAARAGIPSFVVSNFTWDWIYQGYAEYLAAAATLIPAIQAAYRQASGAWRLPMHGGFETFSATALIDIPFVARHATHSREETRTRVGLPLDRKLALPSFGGYGLPGVNMDRLDLGDEWQVVPDITEAAIYEAGMRYEDLIAAVDVVVTKPGYGIISECIANDTVIVYTSRGRFVEYDVLVREMPKFLRCAFIDNASLLAGDWRTALDAAVSAPPPPETARTDGAEVIADMIRARIPSA
jgi:L-arabinokinase